MKLGPGCNMRCLSSFGGSRPHLSVFSSVFEGALHIMGVRS